MGQLHSISHSGMAIFDRPISSMIGGLTIDLASAPIAPGAHRLELDVSIGGIEIYVPAYIRFTIEGGAMIGGYDVHDGAGLWNRFCAWLHLGKTPVRAAANPDLAQITTVHLKWIDGGSIGGVDVYRLSEARRAVPKARLHA